MVKFPENTTLEKAFQVGNEIENKINQSLFNLPM